jgi:hypothetical protein
VCACVLHGVSHHLLIPSARQMREHAMKLPDEQRREFAGKFAMTMLALMDELDDDDDDDE